MQANKYSPGDRDTRPWGAWEVLAVGEDYCVKRIRVLPGCRLSDQRHAGREEIWTVVEGGGVVTLDDGSEQRLIPVSAGMTINIPVRHWHRMHNTGGVPLVLIEIQRSAGADGQLDESDIERRSDDFGRV